MELLSTCVSHSPFIILPIQLLNFQSSSNSVHLHATPCKICNVFGVQESFYQGSQSLHNRQITRGGFYGGGQSCLQLLEPHTKHQVTFYPRYLTKRKSFQPQLMPAVSSCRLAVLPLCRKKKDYCCISKVRLEFRRMAVSTGMTIRERRIRIHKR